ncbi:putative phage abortive infection protein [Rahnella variigena]|uniref:putative phage abortive infection protein n=1 Tax=Rahnella variigena TaxID=574964 RepID=UPI003D26D374
MLSKSAISGVSRRLEIPRKVGRCDSAPLEQTLCPNVRFWGMRQWRAPSIWAEFQIPNSKMNCGIVSVTTNNFGESKLENSIFNASNVINSCVAFGTCAAVLVALFAKKQSSFESTFSLLLAQHNQALKDLKSSTDYKTNVNDILDGLSPLKEQNEAMHELDDFFGSYFRILYHLIKFIDNSKSKIPFIEDKRKTYTSLVRSNLDNEIVFLLAINCSHATPENQYCKYKELIEKYAMFEHLILDDSVLLKYNPSNTSSMSTSIRTSTIMLTQGLKTIFHEIVKSYDKAAFGMNPNYQKYL